AGLSWLNLGLKERVEANIKIFQYVFLRLVEKEKEIIKTHLKDYIFWRDLGEKGVIEKNKNWISLNLNPWVKSSLGYDVVLFTEEKEIITSSFEFPLDKIWENLSRNVKVSFIRVGNQFYLYGIGPVYDDEKKYYYGAYLIFAKKIDKKVIEEWKDFIGGEISVLFLENFERNALRNYYKFPHFHIEVPLENGIVAHIDKEDPTISYFYKVAISFTIFFSFFILIFSILLSLILLNHIFVPFEKLVSIAKEIGNGNYDISMEENREDEIGEFIKIFRFMLSKIKEREEKLITEKRKAEEMMYIDPLTKVYNRRFLEENFEIMKRENEIFSLVFIDLDNFKEVNDKLGHILGDELLLKIVEFFKSNLREKDILVRYGGDEFCLFLGRIDSEKARKIIKRISEKFNEEFSDFFGIKISFAYGVAEYPKDGEDLYILIRKADEEMYKFKG
ncbi:MAG: diguanylate cyclase, partial [Dictyoglomus sp.]